MKTAARLWQGLDCMHRVYRRGWSNGFAWGAGTVLVMFVFLRMCLEAL